MNDLLTIHIWSLRLLGFCLGAVLGRRLRATPVILFWAALALSAAGAVVEYYVPRFPRTLAEASASPGFPFLRDAVGRVVTTAGGYLSGVCLMEAFRLGKKALKRAVTPYLMTLGI